MASSQGRNLRRLTGRHTRVVWSQQQKGDNDWQGLSPHMKLMGVDSDDGKGDHPIVSRTGSYTCPVITPNGDRVIYTDNTAHCVNIVDWDGRNHRTLLKRAYALCVWKDPATGIEWVCVRPNNTLSWISKSGPVVMHQIDKPRVKRILWSKSSITWNWFQLSADGKRASICSPWPKSGQASIPDGSFRVFDKGCWTAIAPDNSYRMWVFDGNHREVKLYDRRKQLIGRIDMHGGQGIRDWEIYHPRWSNDVRIVSVTGPYSRNKKHVCREKDRGNWIANGGYNVELYVGRLSEDLRTVEKWVRVTRNSTPDFFGDVWVAPEQPEGKGTV